MLDMVRGVKDLGLEVCATLGMVDQANGARLAEAGLDYYNHNLDTSREHYEKVIGTRTYDDRLETLENVRSAGMVCSGGILGMGESARAAFLAGLAVLDPPRERPHQRAGAREGHPARGTTLPWDEIVRVCAAARILMPRAAVRLSAGRQEMTEEAQALCFLGGATRSSWAPRSDHAEPEPTSDAALLARVGLRPLADGSR